MGIGAAVSGKETFDVEAAPRNDGMEEELDEDRAEMTGKLMATFCRILILPFFSGDLVEDRSSDGERESLRRLTVLGGKGDAESTFAGEDAMSIPEDEDDEDGGMESEDGGLTVKNLEDLVLTASFARWRNP